MALRLSTLLTIGAASIGCATATYMLPDLFVAKGVPEANLAATTAPAAPIKQASAQSVPAAVQVPDECDAQTWPYISSECQAKKAARARQVRVISTDRDAPRQVPLPAYVKEAAAKPAAEARIQTASLNATPEEASVNAALLPPARPADLTTAEQANKADTAKPADTAQARDIDTTGSLIPAPMVAPEKADSQKVAEKAPAAAQKAAEKAADKASHGRTRLAHRDRDYRESRDYARESRRDYSRRYASTGRNYGERYASADMDSPAQTTVYRYPDGREVIVRPEPRQAARRSYADQGVRYADQGYERSYETPRYYPRQEQHSGGLLGMLFGD